MKQLLIFCWGMFLIFALACLMAVVCLLPAYLIERSW